MLVDGSDGGVIGVDGCLLVMEWLKTFWTASWICTFWQSMWKEVDNNGSTDSSGSGNV